MFEDSKILSYGYILIAIPFLAMAFAASLFYPPWLEDYIVIHIVILLILLLFGLSLIHFFSISPWYTWTKFGIIIISEIIGIHLTVAFVLMLSLNLLKIDSLKNFVIPKIDDNSLILLSNFVMTLVGLAFWVIISLISKLIVNKLSIKSFQKHYKFKTLMEERFDFTYLATAITLFSAIFITYQDPETFKESTYPYSITNTFIIYSICHAFKRFFLKGRSKMFEINALMNKE